MGRSELVGERYGIYCSAGIQNFKAKIARRFKITKWSFFNPFKPAVFFGLYNWVDYLKFLLLPRVKAVFWCGSDIKILKKRLFWRLVLPLNKTKHICENKVEQELLSKIGIFTPTVQPCLVDDLSNVEVNFKSSETPHVYLCVHYGREKEYGVELLEKVALAVPDITFHIYGLKTLEYWKKDNVIYHPEVFEERFNNEIKNYQAALRLNVFDGFAETLAKSAVMGQYPISAIAYPHITHTTTLRSLIDALNGLKKKKKPNFETRNYWKKELSKTLEEIIDE